jgi:hypothetical protein
VRGTSLEAGRQRCGHGLAPGAAIELGALAQPHDQYAPCPHARQLQQQLHLAGPCEQIAIGAQPAQASLGGGIDFLRRAGESLFVEEADGEAVGGL